MTLMQVSYSQIALFDSRLSSPFNNWNDLHVAQGFSWRQGSVSFKSLIESGPVDVTLRTVDIAVPISGAVRSIAVPFDVDAGSCIEVATITDSFEVHIPRGKYRLVFETGWRDDVCWVVFTFEKNDAATAKILICDPELTPPESLCMSAEPA